MARGGGTGAFAEVPTGQTPDERPRGNLDRAMAHLGGLGMP